MERLPLLQMTILLCAAVAQPCWNGGTRGRGLRGRRLLARSYGLGCAALLRSVRLAGPQDVVSMELRDQFQRRGESRRTIGDRPARFHGMQFDGRPRCSSIGVRLHLLSRSRRGEMTARPFDRRAAPARRPGVRLAGVPRRHRVSPRIAFWERGQNRRWRCERPLPGREDRPHAPGGDPAGNGSHTPNAAAHGKRAVFGSRLPAACARTRRQPTASPPASTGCTAGH